MKHEDLEMLNALLGKFYEGHDLKDTKKASDMLEKYIRELESELRWAKTQLKSLGTGIRQKTLD